MQSSGPFSKLRSQRKNAALIAPAPAAADTSSAREGFAGEPDVFRDRAREGIPRRPHRVISQMLTLPWLHRRAGGPQECAREEEKTTKEAHPGSRLAFAQQLMNFFRQRRFVLLA